MDLQQLQYTDESDKLVYTTDTYNKNVYNPVTFMCMQQNIHSIFGTYTSYYPANDSHKIFSTQEKTLYKRKKHKI